MYICACAELKLDGGRVARRGDPVPEAEGWPEGIRRANIRLGHIKVKGSVGVDEQWAVRPAVVGVAINHDPTRVPQWLVQESARRNANAQFEADLAEDAPDESLDAASPSGVSEPVLPEKVVATPSTDETGFEDLLGPQIDLPKAKKKRGRKRKKRG